jgi:hypothetical protein
MRFAEPNAQPSARERLCEKVGARAVYSARPHSRGIDSVRGARSLVPDDGGKSGGAFLKAEEQDVALGAPCLTDRPASRGRLRGGSTSLSALGADDLRHFRHLKGRLDRGLGRGRAICSANLHSRIIDRVRRDPSIFRAEAQSSEGLPYLQRK